MFLLMRKDQSLILFSGITICHLTVTTAWEQCGNFYCPDGNTCCFNGCIPNDMGSYNATCCDPRLFTKNDSVSNYNDVTKTGCPVGYSCIQNEYATTFENLKNSITSSSRGRRVRRRQSSDILSDRKAYNASCLVNEKGAPMADDFVKILPRYHLCQVPAAMTQLHGLQINDISDVKLAYYSSHGSIEKNSRANIDKATDAPKPVMIWIVIHGSGRNADDYFCSALAAVEKQNYFEDVWVIVPRFFEEDDQPPKEFLYWETNHEDGDGTWRYGANSMNGGEGKNTSKASSGVSSYTALDRLIEKVWMIGLPNLQQIVIGGHSSGGQYVHRWSLMTDVWTDEKRNKMKSIVANPSSYIYLSPKRWMKESQTWEVPSQKFKECPNYNQWEWGLDDGGMLNVPYRNDVFARKTKDDIIGSFRQRKVLYLSGSLDLCPGDNVTGIECHSHGIETTCMDELQGIHRFERSELYMQSLTQLVSEEELSGGWNNHERRVVHGVGHDHSLMWTSRTGIDAIFKVMRSVV